MLPGSRTFGTRQSMCPAKLIVLSVATCADGAFSSGQFHILTGTIQKGKKKRVLRVDGSVFVTDTCVTSLGVGTLVNGSVPLEPATSDYIGRCVAGGQCTVTGTFRLDLDAAAALAPGTIIGQPLNTSVFRTACGCVTANGEASFSAQLVKKWGR
jgi:hypothetical protein